MPMNALGADAPTTSYQVVTCAICAASSSKQWQAAVSRRKIAVESFPASFQRSLGDLLDEIRAKCFVSAQYKATLTGILALS